MGIQGLSTLLTENKHSLSQALHFDGSRRNVPVVVDGWSFIYELFNKSSNIPWVYGGEYTQFSRLATSVIQAWINVGLLVYIVFDGPRPELKFQTRIQRITQSQIGSSSLFFRTSQVSRTAPRFLHEHRILPPLSYSAVVQALKALESQTGALTVYFADAEADPYIVELAGRLNAYVIGQDSDFVVLNSPGYLGYVPFNEMNWTSKPNEDIAFSEDLDGFQPARREKKRTPNWHPRLGRGLIPPEPPVALTLSVSVYSPSLLADHLKLPVSLLPLVGALAGNDYASDISRNSIQSLIFERRLSPAQRIVNIASTVESILSAASRRQKDRVDTVTDLITRTIHSFISRLPSHLASGEIDDMVDQIAESTLQYAIPKYDQDPELPASPTCLLHATEKCSLVSAFGRHSPGGELASVAADYLAAYRTGSLSAETVDCLLGTTWPRLFLEHPDIQTVTLIGRPIRLWGYAILHYTIGLPEDSNEITLASLEDESDDDDVIDVVEEQSDDDEGSVSGNDTEAVFREQANPLGPFVIEYVRRGRRLANERVYVPPLVELLETIDMQHFINKPLAMASIQDRVTVLFRVMKCDCAPIRDIPSDWLLPVLSLRWVCQWFHTRFQEQESKDRHLARWTQHEGQCFLACFETEGATTQYSGGDVPLLDRNIQLTAQVLHILEVVRDLTQILWLSKQIPSPLQTFSGTKFHRLLTTKTQSLQLSAPLWQAAISGIQGAFRVEAKSKPKTEKKTSVPSPKTAKGMQSMSLYKLLEDVSPAL